MLFTYGISDSAVFCDRVFHDVVYDVLLCGIFYAVPVFGYEETIAVFDSADSDLAERHLRRRLLLYR